MVMVERNQVWAGSEDSVIYIISTHSMSCNKQLTDPPLQRHGPGCAGQDAGTQVWARPWGEGPHGWGAWFQREGLPWL